MRILGGLTAAALLIAGCAAPSRLSADESLLAIARLEDQRTIGARGELLDFLQDDSPAVRARAATAVGRLRTPNGGERATSKLSALLTDREESVRAAAAFALGLRGDPSASSALLERAAGVKADPSALVRARLVEGASKLEEPAQIARYMMALHDASADVRLEAAAGTARWKTDTRTAAGINARIAEFVASESDLRARTYGLFALERRKSKEGREVFLKSAGASDAEERLFAVRGLATLAGEAAIDEALAAATRDADWRVAVEALRGLAKSSSQVSLEAIAAATAHASHHVRAAAIEAATAEYDAFSKSPLFATTQGVGNFERIWQDKSVAVRCAAMANVARIDQDIPARVLEFTPHEWAALLRAWGKPDGWSALSEHMTQLGMVRDWQSHLEQTAVVEAIGACRSPEADARLVLCLSSPDNGVRLAAVTALLEREKPVIRMEELRQCYATSKGEVSAEVRFNVLKLAAKVGGKEAPYLLESGLSDPDAYVRRIAHDEWEKLTGKTRPWVDEPLPEVKLAIPGKGRLENVRPHVVIETEKGEMKFVLFADEAPEHVLNFLEHMDFYKGTTFHRVVSDFVAQGGDARGDGNGGSSWRGDALRHEIGPRKYVRGSLGMPRNDDWDSGGSQLFITHRATPHLDGRYTIFGELVTGFDVLDALDLGDKIVSVRVVK